MHHFLLVIRRFLEGFFQGHRTEVHTKANLNSSTLNDCCIATKLFCDVKPVIIELWPPSWSMVKGCICGPIAPSVVWNRLHNLFWLQHPKLPHINYLFHEIHLLQGRIFPAILFFSVHNIGESVAWLILVKLNYSLLLSEITEGAHYS